MARCLRLRLDLAPRDVDGYEIEDREYNSKDFDRNIILDLAPRVGDRARGKFRRSYRGFYFRL